MSLIYNFQVFRWGSRASQVALVVKNPPANAGDVEASGLIPGLGRSPGEGNGNPLQYSCLENPMDRGTRQATVHRITKGWTRLSNLAGTRKHTRAWSPARGEPGPGIAANGYSPSSHRLFPPGRHWYTQYLLRKAISGHTVLHSLSNTGQSLYPFPLFYPQPLHYLCSLFMVPPGWNVSSSRAKILFH